MNNLFTPAPGRLEFAKYLRDGFTFELYLNLLDRFDATDFIVAINYLETELDVYCLLVNQNKLFGYTLVEETYYVAPMLKELENLKIAFLNAYRKMLFTLDCTTHTSYTITPTYIQELYNAGFIVFCANRECTQAPILTVNEAGDFEVAPL